MNPGIELFIPNKVKEMKKIRVFVRGEHFKYGECTERSLRNALKNNTSVKVTFTNYKIVGKTATVIKTVDEYISHDSIKDRF